MFRTAIRQASLVGALMLVMAPAAFAAPGGNKSPSSSSISLATVAGAAAATPSYGSAVTFVVSTDATTRPFVHLTCSQNGAAVLESWQAWFYGAVGVQSFNLGPTPAWQSGAADCTASLENWDAYSTKGKITVLASTS